MKATIKQLTLSIESVDGLFMSQCNARDAIVRLKNLLIIEDAQEIRALIAETIDELSNLRWNNKKDASIEISALRSRLVSTRYKTSKTFAEEQAIEYARTMQCGEKWKGVGHVAMQHYPKQEELRTIFLEKLKEILFESEFKTDSDMTIIRMDLKAEYSADQKEAPKSSHEYSEYRLSYHAHTAGKAHKGQSMITTQTLDTKWKTDKIAVHWMNQCAQTELEETSRRYTLELFKLVDDVWTLVDSTEVMGKWVLA